VKSRLFVLPSTTRSDFPVVSKSPERKSSSVGPFSKALPNFVLLRNVVAEGDAVAKQRLWAGPLQRWITLRKWDIGMVS